MINEIYFRYPKVVRLFLYINTVILVLLYLFLSLGLASPSVVPLVDKIDIDRVISTFLFVLFLGMVIIWYYTVKSMNIKKCLFTILLLISVLVLIVALLDVMI